MNQLASVLGIMSGALFLGTNMVCPTMLMASERLPRTELPAESVRVAYVDWRRKRMCHVYQVFPYRMYIDLNRHESRI
jgi:hypothetical protein